MKVPLWSGNFLSTNSPTPSTYGLVTTIKITVEVSHVNSVKPPLSRPGGCFAIQWLATLLRSVRWICVNSPTPSTYGLVTTIKYCRSQSRIRWILWTLFWPDGCFTLVYDDYIVEDNQMNSCEFPHHMNDSESLLWSTMEYLLQYYIIMSMSLYHI